MTLNLQRNRTKFLLLLVSADLLFIAIHILHLITTDAVGLAAQNHSPFVLGRDLGIAESYMYVKEYWTILLLVFIALKWRKFIFIGWSTLFMFIITDDIFQLHEKAGFYYADLLNINEAFNLRANDFGELVFLSIVTIIFLFILVIPYFKSKRNVQQISNQLFVLLGMLIIVGVGLDMVQVMVLKWEWLFNIFGILEDGGEMVVMSFFCWYLMLISDQKELKSPFNYL